MQKQKKALSWLLVFFFMFTLFPKLTPKASAETNFLSTELTVALVGNFTPQGDSGDNWQPWESKNFMQLYQNGIYEKVVTFKKAGNYEYKVALNRSFDVNFPNQNKNLNVSVENTKVIFRFNAKTQELYDSINEPQRFKSSATLVGTLEGFVQDGQDWKVENSKFDLDYIGGGFYKGTFKLLPQNKDFEYKVAYNHIWGAGEIQGDNRKISKDKLDKETQVTFFANPDLNLCTDSINNPEINTVVSLIGPIREVQSGEWDASLKGFEFNYLDGQGKFIFSKYFAAAEKDTTFEYKACENYSWDTGGIPSNGNLSITIPKEGKLVHFVADVKERTIYDSINNQDKIAEVLGLEAPIVSPEVKLDGKVIFRYKNPNANAVYLAGDFNGWDSTKDAMVKGANGVWTIELNLNPGEYGYKFVVDGNWVTDPSNPNQADNGLGGKNSVVKVPVRVQSPVINGRNVTFNYLDLSGKVQKVELAGSILDKDWKERKLLTRDGDKFTITLENLTPGTYQYKFIVDGNWTQDPANPLKTGTGVFDNSIVYVPGMFDLELPFEIKMGTSVELKAKWINQDGSVASYTNVEWSIVDDANNIASIQDGRLYVADLEDGVDSLAIKIKGKDKNSDVEYVKEVKVVRELSEVPGGRLVVLAGTLQHFIGGGDWDPSNMNTRMKHIGDNLYALTIKNLPAGIYEYKVAMGSWNENYGKNGDKDGANVTMQTPRTQDVTFYYSDISHIVTDSTKYQPRLSDSDRPKVLIEGQEYVMKDLELKGVYSVEVDLQAANYSGIKVKIDDKEYVYPDINLNQSKKVKFSYDLVTGLIFNNAVSNPIDTSKIYYDSRNSEYKVPFGAVKTNQETTFNLKTGKDIAQAKLVVFTPNGQVSIDMTKQDKGEYYLWTAKYTPYEKGMYQYYFIVSNGADVKAYGDDDGLYGVGRADDLGKVMYYGLNVYKEDYKTPDWMKNAVIYHIFPDRFYNGDRSNDYVQKLARGFLPYEFYEDWYAIPEIPSIENNEGYKGTKGDGEWCNEMYGGDIRGVIEKLDYLQSLGVNVLYFNPVSKSISNHRYDATDYRELDPLLGSMDDFVELATKAKERGMHIILDGVFNHVSDDSVYFDRYGKQMAKGKPLGAYQYWSRVYDKMNTKGITQQEAEKEVQDEFRSIGITDFHYKDWFKIENRKVDVGKATEHYAYEGWWGFDSMPVIQALNGSEYKVSTWADEIIDGQDSNARFWLRQGSSGWRLDVANEVSDETWQHFRKAVKEEGDNVIIGEIWDDASRYLLGDMYDSVMNYRFRGAVLDFLNGKNDAKKTMEMLEVIREQYPSEAFYAMFNLIDSHDTQRAISAFDGYEKSVKAVAENPTDYAKKLLKLAAFMQMTYPGAPVIYYGDEAALAGADDPDNRRAFPWGKGDKDMVEWYAKLANIRQNYEVLRTGDFKPIDVSDVFAFTRTKGEDVAVVAINAGDAKQVQLQVPSGITKLTDAITGQEYQVQNGEVSVELTAKSGVILVNNYKVVNVAYEMLKDAYDSNYVVEKATAQTAMDDINKILDKNTNEGTEIKVSLENGTLSRDILVLAAQKDLMLVVESNGVEFKFNAESMLRSIPGNLQLSAKTQLDNKDEVEKLLKNQYYIPLNLESNFGNLEGTSVTVTVKVDKEKFDKNMAYVYYYNPLTNQFEQIACKYNDGVITFEIAHCSDYVVTNKEYVANNNNQGNNGSQNNNGNGSTGNKGNQNNNGNGSTGNNKNNKANNSNSKLPKTGGFPIEGVVVLGIMSILIGTIMLKKKEN
ncbi:MAG: alpha-amylase family glycosyl hydrolase [Clostridiales bacterium]|nr:alpha-amylase family glycosyl hydrolase [Clostridiales bacterium]